MLDRRRFLFSSAALAAIAGFLLAVASAVMLARFGEADHPGQSPGGQEPRNAAVGSAPTSA